MILNILIWINILSHLAFLVLELFILPPKLIAQGERRAAVFSKNQAVYNGFLSAGLFWGLMTQDPSLKNSLYLFFLSCIIIAGIFGALTATKRIFFLQALPALLALGVVFA